MAKDRGLIQYEADAIKLENLQKQALNVSVYSPMFAPVIQSIENRIKSCMEYIGADEFEEGRISVTIDIIAEEKEAQNVIIPNTNTVGTRTYKAPRIKYNTTLKLVIKDQVKGDTLLEKMEITQTKDGYQAVPVADAQMKIEDVHTQETL